ncbi:cyclin-F-like [Asterias amurensis]|uniref:cyclin-F-like n=1 Tax=Asterias amurensis TaxID=7602 RepID=UPI003AB2DF7E
MKGNLIPMNRNRRLRSYTLCSLPQEVLIQLFKYLPLKDLLNIKQVCSLIKWLIDSNPRLWTTATLVDEWPNEINFKHFQRAADLDNVEALIKLGIACLYNEGLPESFDTDTEAKGKHAAKFLCHAERLLKGADPFLWALIRPPWSKNGTCCKATVFRLLKELGSNSQECDQTVLYSIARISIILQDDDESIDSDFLTEDTKMWLTKAAEVGSHKAALQLWQYNARNCKDAASKLERIRQLREMVQPHGSKVSKMELYNAYALGKFGGLLPHQAAEATRAYIRDSIPRNSQKLFNVQSKLNSAMRYILVDWLVEVAGMKGYSSHTLHMVINCIDRYLMHQPVSRGNLQLVGITAMVLCSRMLEPDIVTIREAAWLTDGTYKYEKVVRMMGDILATLHGKIDMPSMWEYLILYFQLADAERQLKYLALYISELTLLHVDFGRYSLAHQAASVFYLARINSGCDTPWPPKLVEYTGFKATDLVQCTLHIHKKCFNDEPLSDHRDVKLTAVQQRYAEEEYLEVSKKEILDHVALRAKLYAEDDDMTVDEESCSLPGTPTPCGRVEPFLMSPSRSSRSNRLSQASKDDRGDLVTTPTGELSTDNLERNSHEPKNESFMSLESGYDGDMESDAEGDSVTDTVHSEDSLWVIPAFDARLPKATPSYHTWMSSASSSTAAFAAATTSTSSHHVAHLPQTRPTSSARFTPVTTNSAIPIYQSSTEEQDTRCSNRDSLDVAVPAIAMETQNKTIATDNDPIITLQVKRDTSQVPFAGQSFKFDSSGKLKMRSPRRPLKRLENSPRRRDSKRQYTGKTGTREQTTRENAHTLT